MSDNSRSCKKYLFALFFIICVPFADVQSQTSCSQKLKELQKSYEQGQLDIIPGSLQPCMSGSFTKVEQLQAYRLLILTYIFMDEMNLASNTMEDLLRFEPDYKPNKSLDPIEYILLYNSFRVLPFISFGIIGGVNQSTPRIANNYGFANTVTNPTKYEQGINMNFALSIDWLLYRKLFLTTDGMLMFKSFSSTSQVLLPSSKVVSNEAQTDILVPLTLKWVLGNGKFKFFIRGGMAVDYLLASTAGITRKNFDLNQSEYAGPEVNLTPIRNKFNLSAVGGLGFQFKLGYGFLILDSRYYYGLSNLSKQSVRYDNYTPLMVNYGYLDNDFSIDNIQVNVGYLYSLYKFKKVKTKIIQE